MGRLNGPHNRNKRPTAFGAKLTQLRQAAGLEDQELAVMVKAHSGLPCNAGRISEWEQGKRLPNGRRQAALKAILDSGGAAWPDPVKAPVEGAVTDESDFRLVPPGES